MGAGTGSNLDYIAQLVPKLDQVYLVDLSTSLLTIANQRIADHGWSNVKTVTADLCAFEPEKLADVVTFSYSLTMIPDWHQALRHARFLLKPDGRIGIVDFYVSRKYPAAGRVRHKWWQRHFWRIWFERDNVYPSPDHLPFLTDTFQTQHIVESAAKVPYLPFARVPYYRFIGVRGQ
jgi:S-adenosylmethionine-diacylgycerolhomoserine-N-methlytransferase